MRKLLPFSLVLATPLLAQQASGTLQSPADGLPAAPQTRIAPAMAEKTPVFSLSIGFTYLQTDLTDVPGGAGGYVMGWYGIPQLHLTKHLSVIADFTNFYNWHAHTAENVHGFTGGPAWAFAPKFHVNPFVFAEGGAVRDSKAGVVNWYPAAVGGLGLGFKLTRAVEFQVIPGEYVATHLPNGNWQSNYNAKAGFTFTWSRPKTL